MSSFIGRIIAASNQSVSRNRNPLKKLGTFSKPDLQQQYASAGEQVPSESHGGNPSNPGPNDLEIHIQEMTKLEKECKAILKHTKKLTENIAALNRYQIKISEDLSSSELCRDYCEDLRVCIQMSFVVIQMEQIVRF